MRRRRLRQRLSEIESEELEKPQSGKDQKLSASAVFESMHFSSGLRQQEGVHYHEVARASAHHKKMEDLVAAEIFMTAVEDRKL